MACRHIPYLTFLVTIGTMLHTPTSRISLLCYTASRLTLYPQILQLKRHLYIFMKTSNFTNIAMVPYETLEAINKYSNGTI